jgi:hypothetical protein
MEGGIQMRKLALFLTAGVVLLTSASAAAASTPRSDSYYEVWCTDSDGNLTQAESVDAHAVELGGKDGAIALFSQNYPFGWTCWPVGPFTP